MNIADAISRHARAAPHSTALIQAETGRTMTFAELDRRSSALAAAFNELGLRPRDRVAVLAKNTIEYFVIYAACAKHGAVAQGLNWRLAESSLFAALHDGAPRLVLVQDAFAEVGVALRERYDGATWHWFGEDADGSYDELLARSANGTFARVAGGDEPVMILHTGGTTGASKGAVHSHTTLIAAMANNTIAERIVPNDRYMLIGQGFHSAAVLALNYLRHGCGVVVMNFDPAGSLEAIDDCHVTCFLGFPTMMTYMLEVGTTGRYDLTSLRNIQYGGGAFAAATILGFLDTFPCHLIQCYGTTESIGITFLTQEDHHRAREQPALLRSCGTPAFLNEVRLADDAEHAKEFGSAVGELFVRSPANMLGYWSAGASVITERPDWLPTGDLAYIDVRGYVHIVGRSKDVIISGGENIYATQVENALYRHPDVIEAAVIGVPDETWGEAVKAVLVVRPSSSLTPADVRAWVADELASYQKPKHVEFVSELPRTATGKVLKRGLA